ncbi:DMT family transporter [Jiella avicenniae]|uniref:DMT family transporter n=1 Tax=Jiella avicenniae TaxID=2907202 RepID=A0A9X1P1H3_9HYPH|nr:DMT family transporter [Jiella avicenniae]MCE7028351.1 DMT family transporter [Jiella avicenniae]
MRPHQTPSPGARLAIAPDETAAVAVVDAAMARPVMTAGVALGLLMLGAAAMGISPVFVRQAEVGPFASAFWRVFGSLPLLALWALAEGRMQRRRPAAGRMRVDLRVLGLAGLFFAGDLAFWHLAILHTTIANATFFACLAPLWVALLSRVTIGEAVGRKTWAGLAICIPGAGLLILQSSTGAGSLLGDGFGLATSLFFGLYFLAVRKARGGLGAGMTTLVSSLVTAVILLPIVLFAGEGLLPDTSAGALNLAALGLVSHAGGQGLLSIALGVLSASFSSLVIFVEAVAAALFAWIFAGETPQPAQIAGGCIILTGIFLARPGRAAPASSRRDRDDDTGASGR